MQGIVPSLVVVVLVSVVAGAASAGAAGVWVLALVLWASVWMGVGGSALAAATVARRACKSARARPAPARCRAIGRVLGKDVVVNE